jgi:hypothetical protein
MIRKLKNGRYRLYSLRKDPKTGRRRNLGTFATRAPMWLIPLGHFFMQHKQLLGIARRAEAGAQFG